jgi:hypothetical protein
MSKSNVSNEFY